jgi:hypothetical protein
MNQSTYVLRENTGTTGVLVTAWAAANALTDSVYLEVWDTLQAES